MKHLSILLLLFLLTLFSCSEKKSPAVTSSGTDISPENHTPAAEPETGTNLLPPDAAGDSREFFTLASKMLKMPEGYLELVDKTHPLAENFKPEDPVDLTDCPDLNVARKGLILDRRAAEALSRMSRAASADGVTLLISSAYRSYSYQEALFSRYAERDGEEAASRYSARAGTSQHQLGTTVDFGSISDSFAGSDAGIWMAEHAGDFGWSLSYPRGYEDETGYRWESWHWRWIGRDAVRMQEKYFNGIQQRLLEYWHENAPEIEESLRKDS